MGDKFKIALKNGVIPVVAIDDVNNASPLAEALIEGGLPSGQRYSSGLDKYGSCHTGTKRSSRSG